MAHHKILDPRRVTQRKFHRKHLQILDIIVQNLVTMGIWQLGLFVQILKLKFIETIFKNKFLHDQKNALPLQCQFRPINIVKGNTNLLESHWIYKHSRTRL